MVNQIPGKGICPVEFLDEGSRLTVKPFVYHTCKKLPSNSNHCHTYKIGVYNLCVCHTSEPPGGPRFC